jgi:hypothetical protein
MNRNAVFLSLALCTGVGCVTLPTLPDKEEPTPIAPAASAVPTRPPAPVMPDQVTESNAHQKAEALRQELDYEQSNR